MIVWHNYWIYVLRAIGLNQHAIADTAHNYHENGHVDGKGRRSRHTVMTFRTRWNNISRLNRSGCGIGRQSGVVAWWCHAADYTTIRICDPSYVRCIIGSTQLDFSNGGLRFRLCVVECSGETASNALETALVEGSKIWCWWWHWNWHRYFSSQVLPMDRLSRQWTFYPFLCYIVLLTVPGRKLWYCDNPPLGVWQSILVKHLI